MSEVVPQISVQQFFVVFALVVKDIDDLDNGLKDNVLSCGIFWESEYLEQLIKDFIVKIYQFLSFDVLQTV